VTFEDDLQQEFEGLAAFSLCVIRGFAPAISRANVKEQIPTKNILSIPNGPAS
jgi:hypothetical protein